MEPEHSQRIHTRELMARLRIAADNAVDELCACQDALADTERRFGRKSQHFILAQTVALVATIIALVLGVCVLHLRHELNVQAHAVRRESAR